MKWSWNQNTKKKLPTPASIPDMASLSNRRVVDGSIFSYKFKLQINKERDSSSVDRRSATDNERTADRAQCERWTVFVWGETMIYSSRDIWKIFVPHHYSFLKLFLLKITVQEKRKKLMIDGWAQNPFQSAGPILIANSTFSNNRGHGIAVDQTTDARFVILCRDLYKFCSIFFNGWNPSCSITLK